MEAERWHRPARWQSGPRLVSSHNLYLVERGRLAFQGVSGRWVASAGQILLAPRGTRHELAADDGPCGVLVLRIRLSGLGLQVEADAQAWELLLALARHVHSHGPLLAVGRRTGAAISASVAQVLTEQRHRRPGRLCRVKARVMDVIADVAGAVLDGSEAVPSSPSASFHGIRRVIEHIERDYASSLGVQQAAQMAGLRRSQFHAAFRNYTGLTLVDYLTRVRIGEACRRLRDSPDSVLQVAMQCGFGSLSRFYEAFQGIVRMSPGQWRQRLVATAP